MKYFQKKIKKKKLYKKDKLFILIGTFSSEEIS